MGHHDFPATQCVSLFSPLPALDACGTSNLCENVLYDTIEIARLVRIFSFNSEIRSIFHDNSNCREHISQNYHIRDLRHVHHYFPLSIVKTIVTSRLDYNKSAFRNITFKDITTLQRIQNCLVMVVCRSPRFTRSVAVLLLCIGFLSDIVHSLAAILLLLLQVLSCKQSLYLH